MSDVDTSRISPTAHYTGYVWCKNGLSPRELGTFTGRLMFEAMRGPVFAASLATGVTLEEMLLQRHLLIDRLLTEAIEDGRVGQVLEVACGLSGRGHRFAMRYPEVVYVDGDLPNMAMRKRRMLGRLPERAPNHYVTEINALVDDGPHSIFAATQARFDPSRGAAIITEGLLSYFPTDAVVAMWSRFARLLRDYPEGTYSSDVHVENEQSSTTTVTAFRALLGMFAKGAVEIHFADSAAVCAELANHGFVANVHDTDALVKVVEARLG